MFYSNPHAWPLIQSATLIAVIGFLILRQNPADKSTRFFSLICLSVTIWFIGNALMYSCRDSEMALKIYRFISFLGVSHIVTYVYSFSVSWLNFGGIRKTLCVVAQALGALFYFACLFYDCGVESVRLYDWGFFPQYGFLGKFFLVYFFFFFFLAFYNFVEAYLKAVLPAQKKRIRLVLIAFTVSFFSSFDFIPKLFYCNLYPLGFAATFVWIVLVAYGLLRYQLFSAADLARMVQDMRLATLGMMSASLNHEIKNPIYVMKGRAEIELAKLKDGEVAAVGDARKLCESVMQQSSRILEIIERFSRQARGGKAEAKLKTVDLNVALNEALPLLKYELSKRNVDVAADIDDDARFVTGDPIGVEQILMNLIMNSCHSFDQQAGSHRIQVVARLSASDKVSLSVIDNGSGMTSEQIEGLFKPFKSSKTEGMGLGLVIVKQLIVDMGGQIEVQSGLGKGTSFCIQLKRAPCVKTAF